MASSVVVLLVAFVAALGTPAGQMGGGQDRLLVGVYTATLACTDCSAHRLELTLYRTAKNPTEGTFHLKETFTYVTLASGDRGPDRVIESSGRWVVQRGNAFGAEQTIYRLNPDKSSARSFLRVSDEELREIDARGTDPVAAVVTLRREPTATEAQAGGYRVTSLDAPDVKAAAEFAVIAQAARSGESLSLARIVRAEQQVVSGLSFRLCLEVTSGGQSQRVRAMVYRDLNGHLALSFWLVGECR